MDAALSSHARCAGEEAAREVQLQGHEAVQGAARTGPAPGQRRRGAVRHQHRRQRAERRRQRVERL